MNLGNRTISHGYRDFPNITAAMFFTLAYGSSDKFHLMACVPPRNQNCTNKQGSFSKGSTHHVIVWFLYSRCYTFKIGWLKHYSPILMPVYVANGAYKPYIALLHIIWSDSKYYLSTNEQQEEGIITPCGWEEKIFIGGETSLTTAALRLPPFLRWKNCSF